MNGKVGSINRSYNANYFGISEIESISDLTEIKTSSTLEVEKGLSAATNDAEYKEKSEDLTSRINVENYRQILLLNLSTSNKQNVLEIIKMLEKMEGVVYAGPDYSCGQPGIIPDDSDYEDQWGLSAISASNAWDISTGSTTIRVGVMDTGIADHPDLRENVIEGWDFYNENAVTDDDTNGHGTHVAGIIGAVSNNDLGVTGVSSGTVTITGRLTIDSSITVCYTLNVTEIPNGIYYIKNRETGRYVQPDNDDGPEYNIDGILEQMPYDGGFYQRWAFTHSGDGYYKIMCVHNGFYITVPPGHLTESGPNLILGHYTETNDQKWLVTATDEAFRISAKCAGPASVMADRARYVWIRRKYDSLANYAIKW